MRLIDSDAMCADLATVDPRYKAMIEWGVRVTEAQPTVDAVEVVRCKDCRKYIPCQKLPIGTSQWCNMFDRATCEMNYCGWGERREDDSK